MKIKLQVPVKIDGVDFEAGTYDEAEIPAGNLESLLLAKWARKASSSEAADADNEPAKSAPKPSRRK